MRRLVSIVLLALLGLPLAAPLFAAYAAEQALPACCRRTGAHHCAEAMQSNEESASKRTISAPMSRCPFAPAYVVSMHHDIVDTAATVFHRLQAHSAVLAQTESKLRISRSRSRQKRGPPSISMS